MPDALNKEELLLQNLKDAGCDEKLIKICVDFIQEEKTEELKKILSSHKNKMMKDIRTKQKEVDCLDYLLYSLEKKQI